jgi:hypothetical protein
VDANDAFPVVCATGEQAGDAVFRAVGPALTTGFDDLSGWTKATSTWGRAANSTSRVFSQAVAEAPLAMFKSEVILDAHPLVVAALIREADESTLAGNLRVWAPAALSPFHQWVYYVSALPWPLRDRAFEIRQLFGLRMHASDAVGPSVWMLGEDLGAVERSRAPAEHRERFDREGRRPGAIPGQVHISAYYLRPLPPSLDRGSWRTVLRRLFNIDLDFSQLPAALVNALLVRQLHADHHELQRQAATFEGSRLAARVAPGAGDAFYAAIREAYPHGSSG